ncbi:gsr0611 [Gloeobacter violaceus PCC 7421]|uniref:Gsr0611 protein n=2 Tax=Gloeobacter violaceus TaxID=33072 RepID=Q7NN04_GLOVI|nr:gsr0611 [Gloeobacter violaceus PCC 7421]
MLQARASVENTPFERLMELAEEGAAESRLRGIGATPKFEDLPEDLRRSLGG